MKFWLGFVVVMGVVAAFMFWKIDDNRDECAAKGGVAISTRYEGYVCIDKDVVLDNGEDKS